MGRGQTLRAITRRIWGGVRRYLRNDSGNQRQTVLVCADGTGPTMAFRHANNPGRCHPVNAYPDRERIVLKGRVRTRPYASACAPTFRVLLLTQDTPRRPVPRRYP